MAIRYSGDVEIRIVFRGGNYHASIRSPGFHGRIALPAHEVLGLSRKRAQASNFNRSKATTSEAYDRAALFFVMLTEYTEGLLPLEHEKDGKTPLIRRVFQSACPRQG